MLAGNPQVILFTEVCSPGFGRYAGTYRIATELRNAGYIVQVIEYFTRWTTQELKNIIRKFVSRDTLMIGISSTFLQNTYVRNRTDINLVKSKFRDQEGEGYRLAEWIGRTDWPELYDYIMQCNPKIKVSVGGSHAGKFVLGPTLDYHMVGESEETMLDLAMRLEHGRPPEQETLKLPYTDFTTSTIRYEDNDLIFPKEQLPIEIARGCIFKCSFCSYALNGKKLWEFNRKPELVLEDLTDAYNKYGSTGFMFCDDTYNDSVEKVRTYHQQFKKLPFQPTWSAYARADMIISKPETIDMLYESGLRSVFFGIETLNHETGKRIGKGMHPEKMKEGLYRMKERWPDVIVSCGMIVGLPHDTVDTLRKNNEWFLRDDCPVEYPSYYPLNIPASTHIDPHNDNKKSKISKDPFSYGYEVFPDGYWKSQWMDKTKAEELTQEFKASNNDKPGEKGHAETAPWVFFNRLQNLGYTPNDLQIGNVKQDDIIAREDNLMKQYKARLGSI